MTNPLEPNDLSHLPDEEFNALCPQGYHAPGPEPTEAEGIAEWLYERGRLQDLGTKDWYFRASDLLKQLAVVKAAPPPEPPTVMEALAARPLLEHVARLGDRIGANTVGEVMAISNRAAAWLEANPPGQPVAIEPRGCPLPGACSCVEPATPPPKPPSEKEIELFIESIRMPWILEQISRATDPDPDFDVVIVRAALERWGRWDAFML